MFALAKRGAEKRIALVLGNGSYRHVEPLNNPGNDAAATKAALERLGFSTVFGRDLDQDGIEAQIANFENSLGECNVALIYYSGHGLQINDINYIVPINADMHDEAFCDQLIPLQGLISRVSKRAAITLVFLDACRDNPFTDRLNAEREQAARTKGLPSPPPLATGPGLAPLSETEDTFSGPAFVAFAAAPGRVAWQGLNPISIFTEGLLAHIETTDLSLHYLMLRVAQYVQDKTEGRQEPWVLSSLRVPFFFSMGSLVWFTANFIGFAAFLMAILIHSLVVADWPGPVYVIPVIIVMLVALLFFLLGLGRSYRFTRGEFEQVSEGPWQRSLLGGYFGSLFAAPIIAAPYYIFWDDQWDRTVSFGRLLSEITLGCVFAGVVLGSLSYVLSKRPIWLLFVGGKPSGLASLIGGITGGVLAGILVGPILTLYFGSLSRPWIRPEVLLPGSLLGATILVFAIVTYSVERISYRKMWINAVGSVLATLCVAIISALTFFLIYGIFQDAIESVLETEDQVTLFVIGLAIGAIVGVILGSTISLTLLFADHNEPTTGGRGFFRLLTPPS